MKLFGLALGKEKPVEFTEFRDMVRLAVRRQFANSSVENTDTGLRLTIDGKKENCNLRNLYMEYSKAPKNKDAQIQHWIASLVVDVPDHGWLDAQMTLRPTIKHMAGYIDIANATMQKSAPPDSLPNSKFIGELGVIIMRDLPGTAVAVTQSNLDVWGVTFEEAMQAAMMNMNMLSFPTVTNTFEAGGSTKHGGSEEVGLVFEGDHLVASWLVIERFRDYVSQRLQGDYVVFAPIRSRLIAVRADEPSIINQVQQNNRSFITQNYALTIQAYHVSASTTGGLVTIYAGGNLAAERESLDPSSMFANGNAATLPSPGVQPMGAMPSKTPVDLSSWGGLSESTQPDTGKVRTPFDSAKS